jgi:predicted nucleic acid-binding protein
VNEKIVFDTGALSLHFVDHPGVRNYFDSILSHRSRGLVSSFNLAEFYYKTCQKLGRQTADARYFQLKSSGELSIVYTDDLVRAAGLEKCKEPQSLSLADCFALALARQEKALLVTTDGELAKVKGLAVRLVKLAG